MTKTEIYKLLCDGYAQAKIATILHISKVYVSKITNKFIADGYVFCVNPKSSPKLYKPTDRPLPLVNQQVNRFSGGLEHTSTEVCRVHNITKSYLLASTPKLPVKWDKEWTFQNVRFFQLRQIFDVGMVTIRLIKPRNKPCSVVIWMPERYLSKEQLDDHTRILESYCQKVANWFMKTYHCQLGLPEVYNKMHFGFVEDPDFVHIAKKMNVSKGEHMWVDDSDDHSEWETDDIRLARIKIDLPMRVFKLEDNVQQLFTLQKQLTESVNTLVESMSANKELDREKFQESLDRGII